MNIIVKKTKSSENEKQQEGFNCLFFEARNNVTAHEAEERTFKDSLKKVNPKMGLTNISSTDGELVDTNYGKNHVGS